MQKDRNSTYNLQLNLDKHITSQEKSYIISHTGVKSRTKKENVLKEVKEYAPFLMSSGIIELAIFPANRSISSKEFSVFIENLIVYSTARDRA